MKKRLNALCLAMFVASYLTVLQGQAPADHFRDFVRSEYFDALDPVFVSKAGTGLDSNNKDNNHRNEEGLSPVGRGVPIGAYATMYCDERYKLSIYHNKDLGELYDMQQDPGEFNDLWDSPEHQQLKAELIYKSFNAHVTLTTDVGSRRIAPM